MTVTMLHYHLRRGGVTTVIRNAQRALAGTFDVRVLADFGYDDRPARSRVAFLRDAEALRRRLTQALRHGDVLHTHNLGLGKHPRLTGAVKLLAETGRVRILNQVHDFPEDHRPAQRRALRHCTGRRDDRFWRQLCYYDLPNVRWCTLTTHDAGRLAERGIPRDKIDVLPNPIDTGLLTNHLSFRAGEESQVSGPDDSRSRPEFVEGDSSQARNTNLAVAHKETAPAERAARGRIAAYAAAHGCRFDPRQPFLLSPMKVMVRKNNAEAVDLIRRLGRYQLVISLDAASPADRAYSTRLKRQIHRENLPVVIGVGAMFDNPLPLFHAAHAILTTSTQEGFGYAFLEGWLCGKLVVGRDIPEVTRDFKAAGMRLDHLYQRPDAGALRRLLARPSGRLIQHNRQVVLREYSLAAYARRYAHLVAALTRDEFVARSTF